MVLPNYQVCSILSIFFLRFACRKSSVSLVTASLLLMTRNDVSSDQGFSVPNFQNSLLFEAVWYGKFPPYQQKKYQSIDSVWQVAVEVHGHSRLLHPWIILVLPHYSQQKLTYKVKIVILHGKMGPHDK